MQGSLPGPGCPASVFTIVHLRRGCFRCHGKFLCSLSQRRPDSELSLGWSRSRGPLFHSSSGPILLCSAKIKRLSVYWAVVISALPPPRLLACVSTLFVTCLHVLTYSLSSPEVLILEISIFSWIDFLSFFFTSSNLFCSVSLAKRHYYLANVDAEAW